MSQNRQINRKILYNGARCRNGTQQALERPVCLLRPIRPFEQASVLSLFPFFHEQGLSGTCNQRFA